MDSIWSKFVMKQLVWTLKKFKPWCTIQNEALQTIQHHMKILWTFNDTNNQWKWQSPSYHDFVELKQIYTKIVT